MDKLNIQYLMNLKDSNKKIGFLAGAMDLFHAGHIMAMAEAKSQCDILIIGLQSDPSIDRSSKNSPIQGLFERYVSVSSCEYVDIVIPYSTEEDLYNMLKVLPIQVRILDEEYKSKGFTGDNLNIPIYFNSRKHNYSSSGLRKRVSDN